jgi:hypothetical protein
MTALELYAKFLVTLAIGLAGVGVVLVTLIETVLCDWDPVLELTRWWRRYSHRRPTAAGLVRAEDILSELESRHTGRYAPRAPASALDRRREVLRDVREAERRASSPRIVEAL